MKLMSIYRAKSHQRLLGWVGFVFLVVFAAGCCTCTVEPPEGKILMIVKRPGAPDGKNPAGAAIGFTKIKNGDKLLLINRFGKDVEVEFPPQVIAGEREFTLKKCKTREVTFDIANDTLTSITVDFSRDGDHGGAHMIIEPPGGG